MAADLFKRWVREGVARAKASAAEAGVTEPYELDPENRPAMFLAKVVFQGQTFASRLIVTVEIEMGQLYCGDTERVVSDIADQVAHYLGKDQRLETYVFDSMWIKPWEDGAWHSVPADPVKTRGG